MEIPTEIITAIGTPLNAAEQLHVEGLERQLADQESAGIQSILAAGSMGAMQMLRDETYRALVAQVSEQWHGGELLVGVGDVGFSRTRDRIAFVTKFKIDGVVVLTPYLFKFTQQQLAQYFIALADYSPVPVYLYDLPALTGTSIELETYQSVAKHPNIGGAKISGRLEFARALIRRLDSAFRIIVSAPEQMGSLLKEGVTKHLDGMFSIAPQWTMGIVQSAGANDWDSAATYQAKLNRLRDVLLQSTSVMAAYTVMMNARGIPGAFHGLPIAALNDEEREALLSNVIMKKLVAETAVPPVHVHRGVSR